MRKLLLSLLFVLTLATGSSAMAAEPQYKTATFAGGCFWCMEVYFDAQKGITSTIVGYTGGDTVNPTYEEVSSGKSGHIEAIQVEYDPAVISYEQILAIFWKHIDPTDTGGQFVDRGSQYHTAIWYHDDIQKTLAEASKEQVANELGKPVATKIVMTEPFYPAEDYHQEYYKKNPERYQRYHEGSRRKESLEKIWGKK